MTLEEMADKHAEEYVMREDVITENDRVPFDNGYGFQTVSFEDEVKKGYKDGFLAGLKAERQNSQLTKAKEILAKLLEEEKNNMYWEMNGSDKSSYYEVRKQAEQFLKEMEK